MKLMLVLAAIIGLSTAAFAQDIAGQYRVEGSNPGGVGRYSGQVQVVQSGDTFQVAWQIGGQTHKGTGLLVGKVFSVTYQQQGAAPGIAVYEVGSDGTLSGAWAPMGSSAIGIEIWKPDGGL